MREAPRNPTYLYDLLGVLDSMVTAWEPEASLELYFNAPSKTKTANTRSELPHSIPLPEVAHGGGSVCHSTLLFPEVAHGEGGQGEG